VYLVVRGSEAARIAWRVEPAVHGMGVLRTAEV
jgi:hypothetical protein